MTAPSSAFSTRWLFLNQKSNSESLKIIAKETAYYSVVSIHLEDAETAAQLWSLKLNEVSWEDVGFEQVRYV